VEYTAPPTPSVLSAPSSTHIQANELLPRSVVLIAPTSTSARPASFRPEIDVAGRSTRVLVERVGVVDAARIGEFVGAVTPELWRSLAVLIVVGGVLGLLRLVFLLLEDAPVQSVVYQVVLLTLNVLVGLVVLARLRSLRRR
jgi:mRNA interferase MazF